ncbi:hypothetical protein AA0111_g1216 [Alternaria arborescens]|uniref:hypothetical protein n=1 Tax=Alternaria arborescens TaxID=156630 RepID=UPI001074AD44|nr:hypothetical protein AA0111_g1216 [Alternaria arborescens]RYO41325.1 hypothetical protein AA0111_g1216 [Alternaria arborescens]
MLSLPLATLSTARDTDASEQQFIWQKETRDLTLIIDSYGSRDGFQLMKVVQGSQIRQTIEIERLINEGNDMTRLYQERGVQIQTDQLPITAIVRSPLLAIRWQLANNKLRRVQMRFKSDKDFDTVSNYLLQIGLHMSGTKGALSKPKLTAPLPSPAQASPSRSSPKAIASPEEPSNRSPAGRLSCPPSRLAEISSGPYTSHSASANTSSQLQGGTCPRPASATPAYAKEDLDMSASLSGPLAPPVLFARPTSATSDILGRSHLDISPPSDQHMSAVEGTPHLSTERPDTAMLFSRPGSANRPDSANRPGTANRPDSAETPPPRRELPFPRLSSPRSSGSDSVRPSTGTMGPPPLPSRAASGRPSSSRSAMSKEIELPPLPQPTVVSKTVHGDKAMQRPPRTPNQDHFSPLRAKTSPHEGVENRSPLTLSPMSSPLSFKKLSPTALPTPLGTLSNAAQNTHNTVFQSAPITPPTSVTGHRSGTNETDGLAAYATQSDEERRALLNEFVFRHLESDDFLTLVQDMETAWARVAMGM